MNLENFSLEKFLTPHSVESFFANFFTKRPFVLHQKTDPDFTNLINLQDIHDILQGTKLSEERVSLLGPIGEIIAHENGFVNVQALYDKYATGSTIHILDLQEKCPPVGRLYRRLRSSFEALGYPLVDSGGAVLFLTPSGSRALAPHVDEEDLFILQVAGTKNWRFYGEAPRPGFVFDGQNAPAVSLEAELKPGSMAYIPREFIHNADTTDSFSLAITLGLRPYSWSDLLESMVAKMGHTNLLAREPIGPGMLENGKLSLEAKEKLLELLAQLTTAKGLSPMVDQLQVDHGSPSISSLHLANQVRQLQPNIKVIRKGKATVELGEDKAIIHFGKRFVKGPAKLEAIFLWISNTADPFHIDQLPGSLKTEARLTLIKKLILEGLLEICEP